VDLANRQFQVVEKPWTLKQRLHLGTKLVELLVETLGIIEAVQIREGRKTTIHRLQFTGEFDQWMKDYNQAAALTRPMLLPTVVPKHTFGIGACGRGNQIGRPGRELLSGRLPRGVWLKQNACARIPPIIFRVVGRRINYRHRQHSNETARAAARQATCPGGIVRSHGHHAFLVTWHLARHRKRTRLFSIERHAHLRRAAHSRRETGCRQRARGARQLDLAPIRILVSPHLHELFARELGHGAANPALRPIDVNSAAACG
jgi:hypothetical protein